MPSRLSDSTDQFRPGFDPNILVWLVKEEPERSVLLRSPFRDEAVVLATSPHFSQHAFMASVPFSYRSNMEAFRARDPEAARARTDCCREAGAARVRAGGCDR